MRESYPTSDNLRGPYRGDGISRIPIETNIYAQAIGKTGIIPFDSVPQLIRMNAWPSHSLCSAGISGAGLVDIESFMKGAFAPTARAVRFVSDKSFKPPIPIPRNGDQSSQHTIAQRRSRTWPALKCKGRLLCMSAGNSNDFRFPGFSWENYAEWFRHNSSLLRRYDGPQGRILTQKSRSLFKYECVPIYFKYEDERFFFLPTRRPPLGPAESAEFEGFGPQSKESPLSLKTHRAIGLDPETTFG